jgi:hypothetical protein
VQDAPETKHSNWAATGPRGTYPSRVGQSLPAGQSRKPNMGPSLPQLAGLAAAALVVGSHEMALALGGSIVVPQVLIGQLPQGGHVPPDGLGDETGFVSPPRIERPYFVCSDVIVVTGVLPGAKLEIEVMIAGRLDTVIFQAGDDGAYQVDLPGKLQTTADWIRARQLWGGETSAWDAGPTPSNHALEVSATYPNGLPVPTAYYEPFYDCGIRTGMSNFVPGSRVKMTILRVNGSTSVLFDYPKWAAWAAEGGGNQFFIDDHLEASWYRVRQSSDSSRCLGLTLSSRWNAWCRSRAFCTEPPLTSSTAMDSWWEGNPQSVQAPRSAPSVLSCRGKRSEPHNPSESAENLTRGPRPSFGLARNSVLRRSNALRLATKRFVS